MLDNYRTPIYFAMLDYSNKPESHLSGQMIFIFGLVLVVGLLWMIKIIRDLK